MWRPLTLAASARGTGHGGAVLPLTVVRTSWNACPCDDNDVRGPYEEALIVCPVPDEKRPDDQKKV